MYLDIMLIPFQSDRKHAHHCRSDLKPLFNLTLWGSSFATSVIAIIRLRNDLPGLTMQHACCNRPIRDSNSLFVHDRLLCYRKISLLRQTNFSFGRRSVFASVSSSMPRNVITLEGPSVLSGAIGTPSLELVSKTLSSALLHSWDSGAPNNKKSSK